MSSAGVIANPDSDVHITKDNQKKINTFAVRNGWMEELEAELKAKETDLRNLEDVEQEVVLLTESIPMLVGDSYVHFEPDAAGEEVARRITKTKEDIKKLNSDIAAVKAEMNKLKNELYERFGDNINLENEDA